MGEKKVYFKWAKIVFITLFAFSLTTIYAQTMVIKKADGTYVQTAITNAVEVYFSHPCPGTPTVDYGGITYNTVQIGTQCWMKENLNVGTMKDVGTDQTSGNGIEKYCYNNDPANCTTYGGLYQWAEAVQYLNGATNTISPDPAFSGNVQGICPSGWHIPTDAEFSTLQNTVGNDNSLLNVGELILASNISGFSALLGGYIVGSTSTQLGTSSLMWSSTEAPTDAARAYSLFFQGSNVFLSDQPKSFGYSVRCIKD